MIIQERFKKVDFLDAAVLSLFFIFCFLLFSSLIGWFNIYFISIGLISFLILLFIFHKRITFSKKYLLFFISTCFLITGVLLFKGFFAGDATNYWLPLGKEIVLQHKMPDLALNLPNFSTSRGPLLQLLFALTFIFFPFKEIFVFWIPILFVFLTVLLLYQWAKDKNLDKKYLLFAVLLFLANPIFLKNGWNILQESPLLFFFTGFFYFLEKYQKNRSSLNLLLIFISFVLAFVSKESAVFLSIPLIIFFFKYKFYQDKKFVFILLTFSPLIIWFLRNYLIFDNPFYPFLSSFFKGRYFAIDQRALQFKIAPVVYENYKTAIFVVIKKLLLYFPFIIFSIIQLFRKKKFVYLLTFIVFIIGEISLTGVNSAMIRHYYPLLGLFIIYGLEGVKDMKSKIVLSFLFGLAILGLFFTPLINSSSQFISPIENSLTVLFSFIKIIVGYKFIIALLLTLCFYFFLIKKNNVKFLILSLFVLYSIKNSTVQISWLNIWLPVLIFIVIVLFWFFFKQRQKTVISFLILVLIINSWGLAMSYFLGHKKFIFPKKEAYGVLPTVGNIINQREKNNDFYVLVGHPAILSWWFNQKVLFLNHHTFNLLTDLEYNGEMEPVEIYNLFKRSKIKYIVKNDNYKQHSAFYEKIKSDSEYFQPHYHENDFFLWQVKD